MRYEAMRLLQFLFSLALIVGAFAVGVLAGWYRWAPRSTRPTREVDEPAARAPGERPWQEAPNPARSTLFSPEGEVWPSDRLPRTVSARSPRTVVLPADIALDLRERPRPMQGELGTGQVPVVVDDTTA